MHYVVFEINHERKYRIFESRESFLQKYQTSFGNIIAEGITKAEALRLCGASDEVINSLQFSPSYEVVFEYTAAAGGYYGFRYSLSFNHPFEVSHLLLPDTEIIVAEALNETQCRIKLCEVPPLCRYMAAVENAFSFDYETPYIPEALEMHLNNAAMAVTFDKEFLWTYARIPLPVPDALRQHYEKLILGHTAKAVVMQTVWTFYNHDENDLFEITHDDFLLRTIISVCRKALKTFPVS